MSASSAPGAPSPTSTAETPGVCPLCGQEPTVVATSSVSAEAEQGDGPAAASAGSSAVGEQARTSTVSVVVGPQGAAASCPVAVVVTGPYGAAAASEVGVVAVGRDGAAASCNAANGSKVTVDGSPASPAEPAQQRPASTDHP